MALYFASRGTGQLRDNATGSTIYRSPARVLLNGLGSDELLGGYGRHRAAFKAGGWRAVIDEVGYILTCIGGGLTKRAAATRNRPYTYSKLGPG
jgi:asparagine synthetase B (glutamine-hydrolysing)